MTREEVENKIENTLLKLRELMMEYDADFEYLSLSVWRNCVTANNDYWESEDKPKIYFHRILDNDQE